MNGALLRTLREEMGFTAEFLGKMLEPIAFKSQISHWEYEQEDIPPDVERQVYALNAGFHQAVAARTEALRRLGARATVWRYRTIGDFRDDCDPPEPVAYALMLLHGAVANRVFRRLIEDGIAARVMYLHPQSYWRWCASRRCQRTDETRDEFAAWAAELLRP